VKNVHDISWGSTRTSAQVDLGESSGDHGARAILLLYAMRNCCEACAKYIHDICL